MKKTAPWIAVPLAIAICLLPARPQEREDRTLLGWEQMRSIINEASGERAMHHVLELVPYPRVRDRAEYQGHFRESEVMARFATEYGYSDVEIESFPSRSRTWHASQAELWMKEPESRKLYDVYDVAISISANSETGDVTAELVDVGQGEREEDYEGKDVAGKIVLGSGRAGTLQRLGVFGHGAVGVVSYNSIRADSYPDEILTQGISANAPEGKKPGFGWAIAPRVGRELADRLARGEKVTLRSIVKSETFPGEMEIVHATIPGDGTTDQEIMISAHLYEGYQKQGANDDNSGCAVTLEMGRTLLRLIEQGKLPRPKRTIHFLWVPEISGTNAWLEKHDDIRERLIADLNFDMEGLSLRLSGSAWVLHRTPDTFPSFLNDLCASILEFVANLNRERVRYRIKGYRFTLPVVSPNGTMDPFYIHIEKHYGASDHVIFLNNGIPAVIFVTWPDMWYHSSQDTPDKLDSTQFKRVAVVGVAAASALASAGDPMGAKVAAESLARGSERMGEAQRKGLGYLADAADAAALPQAYREAWVAVRHQTEVEKAVVRSTAVLFNNRAEAEKKLAGFDQLVEQRGTALQNEVKAFYELRAAQEKTTAVEPALSDQEKEAARLVVEREPGAPTGFRALAQLPAERRDALQASLAKIPSHMLAEYNILLGKRMTVLEIRDFLSGEFEPLALSDLMEALRGQEEAGFVKLTEKPEEPPPARRGKKGKQARKL